MNNITTRSFITGITALAVATVAAFFSVVGISKLFGGSPTETMIMGAVLEAGKLVCASMAYTFFKKKKRLLFSAFTFFTVVMMLVTSIGIYGFLSSSYKDVAQDLTISETRIESLEDKQSLFNDRLERYDQEREILLEDKTALRTQLQSAQEKYNERGWATDKETVERIQDQIQETQTQIENLNNQISAASDSIGVYKERKLELQTQDTDVKSKLGPVIQTAELFGISRDNAVLIFIAMIMLVFDPMAVLLVIAFNVQTGRHSEDQNKDIAVDRPNAEPVRKKTEASEKEEVRSMSEIHGRLKQTLPDINEMIDEAKKEYERGETKPMSDVVETEEPGVYEIHNLKPTPSMDVSEILKDMNKPLPEKDEEMFDKTYQKMADSNEITREDVENIKKEIENKKKEREERELEEVPSKEYHIGSNGGMKIK